MKSQKLHLSISFKNLVDFFLFILCPPFHFTLYLQFTSFFLLPSQYITSSSVYILSLLFFLLSITNILLLIATHIFSTPPQLLLSFRHKQTSQTFSCIHIYYIPRPKKCCLTKVFAGLAFVTEHLIHRCWQWRSLMHDSSLIIPFHCTQCDFHLFFSLNIRLTSQLIEFSL